MSDESTIHLINGVSKLSERFQYRLEAVAERINQGQDFENVMERAFGNSWKDNKRIEQEVREYLKQRTKTSS